MDDIAAVRDFNRFHTRLVGALNEHLLQSEFTLPQARVLYEIAAAERLSARDMAEILRVDTGYLSRLVSGLEVQGLVARTPSPENAKRLGLTLTTAGRAAFARLDAASAEEVAGLLAPLDARERQDLVAAMGRIRRLLGDGPKDRAFVLREPVPGDMGWIVHAQARLYAQEHGWDWTFEGVLAEIVAQFVKTFDPARERCWVAEVEGRVAGSVFVVRQDDRTAKLRMLYVDQSVRGLGLGRRLVDAALAFARAGGYARMVLWTNDILVSARRIYQATGFTLLEEQAHHSFGKDLVGQTWGREL